MSIPELMTKILVKAGSSFLHVTNVTKSIYLS